MPSLGCLKCVVGVSYSSLPSGLLSIFPLIYLGPMPIVYRMATSFFFFFSSAVFELERLIVTGPFSRLTFAIPMRDGSVS